MGLGHLNRCALVLKALLSKGFQASLAVADNPTARSFLKDLPVHYLSQNTQISEWPKAHACLVDLYNYNQNFYDLINQKYQKTGIFDDFQYTVPQGVSLVVNPNLGVRVQDYPLNITALTGARYFPLRSEFKIRNQKNKGQNIFLCLGGSDPEDQSPRLAGILREISDRPIDLLLGPGCEHNSSEHKFSKIKGLNLHCSLNEPSRLMKKARFAVSAGGSMLYELAACGTPTACLALSPGQAPCAKEFHQKGAALYLGFFQESSDQKLAELLRKMESDSQLRLSMGKKAASLVDGRGAERLALGLEKWLKGGLQ